MMRVVLFSAQPSKALSMDRGEPSGKFAPIPVNYLDVIAAMGPYAERLLEDLKASDEDLSTLPLRYHTAVGMLLAAAKIMHEKSVEKYNNLPPDMRRRYLEPSGWQHSRTVFGMQWMSQFGIQLLLMAIANDVEPADRLLVNEAKRSRRD